MRDKRRKYYIKSLLNEEESNSIHISSKKHLMFLLGVVGVCRAAGAVGITVLYAATIVVLNGLGISGNFSFNQIIKHANSRSRCFFSRRRLPLAAGRIQ